MSAKILDVVCVGSAIVDVISQTDDAFLDMRGLVKGSMQLIDDDKVHVLYADMGPAIESSGGSAANTSAGIASFGGKAGFIGKVADDELGGVFAHDIRATGVQYAGAVHPQGSGTARCLILVTPDAQRTMSTFLGVAGLIGPSDVDESLIATAKIVYCEGYLWDMPAAKEALAKALGAAKEHGGKAAFSLSDSFCVDRHRGEFLDLLENSVDILFANSDEVCSLYETDSFDEASERAAAHCEIACLTRGANGSTVVSGAERIEIGPQRVENVLDTTGAGDLYAAGFLYGLTNDRGLEESGRLASLAAAECISHLGARPQRALAEFLAS